MYKVTEDDLIGQLEGFPVEVVQAMIERQVEQGNPADVAVFQKNIDSNDDNGGFWWSKTRLLHDQEGERFWIKVISDRNFDSFFEVYPKKASTQDLVSEKKEAPAIVTEKKIKPETKKAVDKKEKRRASFRHLLN